MGLPRSLEKSAETLGLSVLKDSLGARVMRKMSKPLKDGSWHEDLDDLERLVKYCEQDVENHKGGVQAHTQAFARRGRKRIRP